jgi:hypothetical protein
MTGQLVTDKWVEFGTPNSPQTLREIIPAELDIDIDVTEVMRNDLAVVRKQKMEFVSQVVMPLMPLINQQGKQFNAVEFVKDAAKDFETLSNPEKYFLDIQMPIMPGMPIAPGGVPPVPGALPQGIPNPQSIQEGAEEVNLGV